MTAPDVSVVVPIFNNESTIDALVDRIVASLEPLGVPFEMVMVDDGSRDGSLPLLLRRAAVDPRLRVYALKGKRTVLLWCRDPQNTWQSELEQGRAAEQIMGETIDLRGFLGESLPERARAYDPWMNHWTDLKPDAANLTLPGFSRSLVVRLDFAK